MARRGSDTDFDLNVEGVGNFRFARRRMADEMKIQVEYARIIDGVEQPTVWLDRMGGAISTLKVLTVKAPDGFDIDDLDPLDEESYIKLLSVYDALAAKEESFRSGKRKALPQEGQGTGENY